MALAAAALPAPARRARQQRLAAIAILGVLALGTMVWQGWAAGQEIARLKRNDHSTELAIEVKSLKDELAKLRLATQARSLDGQTTARLIDLLRAAGSHKVVVSCPPNDIEAYEYATDIADALKSANWDARGPETTMIFGNIRAMGVNVFDHAAPGSDTAKILVEAFEKTGIPYQTRVPPSTGMDVGTVELFIGAKPRLAAPTTAETGIDTDGRHPD
ncbi:MAG TPA: hypothetical protein VL985_04600 [Stellaceae bacterium]|nr:hypothetical protein [Stellaceae bacterium]